MMSLLSALVLLLLAGPASAENGCMPTYAFRCPCRPNCDQAYCEKYCWLCGTTPTQCQYCCNPNCACGAIGKCGNSDGLLDFAAGLFASRASAAEPAAVNKADEAPREYTNAHGDFLIVPREKAASQSYSGIGVRLVKTRDALTIAEVFKGSPAEKAGLKPGERIVSIDMVPAAKLGLDAAGKALRGKDGSRVRLAIRGKDGKSRDVEAIRSDSALASARSSPRVTFRSAPPDGKGACASKSDTCLFLYKDDEGCHYTCQAPAAGK